MRIKFWLSNLSLKRNLSIESINLEEIFLEFLSLVAKWLVSGFFFYDFVNKLTSFRNVFQILHLWHICHTARCHHWLCRQGVVIGRLALSSIYLLTHWGYFVMVSAVKFGEYLFQIQLFQFEQVLHSSSMVIVCILDWWTGLPSSICGVCRWFAILIIQFLVSKPRTSQVNLRSLE